MDEVLRRWPTADAERALQQGDVRGERQRPGRSPGRDQARGEDDHERPRRSARKTDATGTAAHAHRCRAQPTAPPRTAPAGRSRGGLHDAASLRLRLAAAGGHQEAHLVLVGAATVETSPTSSPRYITPIRSDSSRTSSSSAETSSTACPASRFAIAWRWMNSMLPTSRPRVGWSRTSSFELAARTPGRRPPSAGCHPTACSAGRRRRRPDVEPLDRLLRRRRRSPRRCAGCPGRTAARW